MVADEVRTRRGNQGGEPGDEVERVLGDNPYGCLLVQDVSQRRTLDRMPETLDQLQVHGLENALGALLANHDFLGERSPVRVIPDAAEAVEDSVGAGGRLQRRIPSLLELARLDARLPLRRRPLELGALASEIMRDTRPLARAGGVRGGRRGTRHPGRDARPGVRRARGASHAAGGHLDRVLGLTFARLAMRAHGGDATIECRAAGGTVFRLTPSAFTGA